jgi:hypothetical protein
LQGGCSWDVMEGRGVLLAAGDKFVGYSISTILEQKICGKRILQFEDGMDALESILLKLIKIHVPTPG